METTTSPSAFCAEIGDAFYAVTECTGVTRIEFRDGYIKLTGSEMTYKMLTTFDAGEMCIRDRIGTEAGDDLGRQPRSAEDAGEADGGDGQHLQAARGNGRKIARGDRCV